MEDNKYVAFFQWALPQLNLRWRGFRKVRRQVRKRIEKRIAELKLTGLDSYKKYLRDNKEEWHILDHFCRITISRFYRDRIVFDYLGSEVLPVLVNALTEKGLKKIRVWSAGCASGEEAYTMAILWHFAIRPQFPALDLEIIASDIDAVVIERGKASCYTMSSLKNLPEKWLMEAFDCKNNTYYLKKALKKYVRFSLGDIRKEAPADLFHIVFCRNLAFTYFDIKLQLQVLEKIYEKMAPGGLLITGTHEKIPAGSRGFTPWLHHLPIYQKTNTL
jgi:chemotaxis protein methyltransferase CheR